MKRNFLLGAALSIGFALAATSADAQQIQRSNPRTSPVFAGYLEVEFANASRGLKGAQAPAAYNIINYSFCTDKSGGNGMINIAPSPAYGTRDDLRRDVAAVKAQGGVAQCSLGGANSAIRLDTPQAISNFVNSLNQLYDDVGFNGIDIDLEGASFRLDPGDTDFRNPTTPSVRNFITALDMFLDARLAKDPNFFLTMAPETFFVQAGFVRYGPTDLGIPAGAALPIIEAFRDRLGSLYVQYYNSGDIPGLDRVNYRVATTDFIVALPELLLQGFPVAGGPAIFRPLRPQQVGVGLPATAASAGTGFQPAAQVVQALRYITQGTSAKVGTYNLVKQDGYPTIGVMAFSINQDVQSNGDFSRTIGQFLSTLPRSTPSVAADAN